MICRSVPIEPGERTAIYCLVPDGLQVQALDVDPPTAARFKIHRVDLVKPGETFLETGVRSLSVRIEVENVSTARAVFAIAVQLGRDLGEMAREIGNAADRAWRGAN